MKKKAVLALFAILTLVLPGLVLAMDFGLIFDQTLGFGGIAGYSSSVDYSGAMLPRFSILFNDDKDLYISAALAAKYSNEWSFVPELLRTELHWFLDWGDVRIGRMHYSDPLGFVAGGLFDGVRVTYDTTMGSFSAGAWYTGFLYKKRANIAMTSGELSSLNAKLDFGSFVDTYFAPRRLAFAVDWEHPSLVDGFLRAKASFLGQFDLAGEDLHSQYLISKLTIPFLAFSFDLGGSLGFLQKSGDAGLAFALELGATWTLPTAFQSRLSFLWRYASGVSADGNIGSFLPITSTSQSPILQPYVPGTSMIMLDYSIRFNRTMAASVSSFYFIRNDLYTYHGYPVTIISRDNSGHFLGKEFFGRFFWSLVSDIHLNFGGGLFVPAMGNVVPKQANLWRIELGLAVSLY